MHWRELNAGKPVLTSDLGEKGLRDPFVIRSPEGDKFYLIATDLKMYENSSGSWDYVQRHGSKSIMIWESTDLVHWTDRRLVEVAPDNAGNTWAPEAYWDVTLGEYVVFWASKFYADDDPDHTGSTYNKMLYATTKDFRTFSEPKVWDDPGYSAVADSPAGPFTDALGKPLVAKGQFTGQMIDPAVFTDDDGQAYLYRGNGHGYVVPLNDDMVSFDATQVKDITQTGFREGSFVVKRQGTYYFMWSEDDTRSENYHVAYATGPSPLGPWTKRGTILSKRPEYGIKGTGHHSVVNVPGTDDWYVVYHRFALNGPGKPGGDGTHRETTVDRLEFAADGTILPVVPTLESIRPVRTDRS